MKLIFNMVEDNNGVTGLLYENAPSHFDAIPTNSERQYYNPMQLLAHDILEHDIKNDNGSVECELMAIGGAAYGRGNHGEVTSQGIENDIIGMARNSMLELKNTNKGIKKFEPIEWLLEEIDIKKLKNGIRLELEFEDVNWSKLDSFIKLAFQYIRIGARRAEKRYKNSFDMFNLFDKLTRELSRVTKYMEEFEQLIVQICFKNQSFKVYTKSLLTDNYY